MDDDLPDEEPTFERISSVLGSSERGGRWIVSDEIEAVTRLGDVTLDFRRADLPPSGVVEIDCDAILGSVHIVVPMGAEVDLGAIRSFLGTVKQGDELPGVVSRLRELVTGEYSDDSAADDAHDLVFVVRGRVVLGSIEVTSR